MCGIVGYIGARDCTEVLIQGLEKLEYRGYDSAGIAVFEGNGIKTVKAKGKLVEMKKKIEEKGRPVGHCGIGHTRWASHGEPSDANSHPHSNGRVTIVHNGVIENYVKLKEFLSQKGYVFNSQTDSEVVACLIDYYYDGKDPYKAIRDTILELEGSYALGIIFKDFPNRVYATRKESPLIVGKGVDEAFIASDIPAILKYTKEYYIMEQDEIVLLDESGITFYDIHGDKVEKQVNTAEWDVEQAQKGGYPHFMLKEIHEQPEALTRTLSQRIKDGLPCFDEIKLTDEKIKGFGRIFIVACGSSMHAGMLGKYCIEKLARIPVTVELASEFIYMDPIVTDKDLVILVSQSGETADTISALKLAKSRGASTLGIVNVQYSTISRNSDMTLLTLAGPEIAVATTKAYTMQVGLLYLLGFRFALASGKISEEKCRRYVEQILKTPEAIAKVIENKDYCQYVASKLVSTENLFFIGRGFDYALSLEGSLKLKEISYIHSEAYAAGELKHGTISLIVEGIPVITVATQSNILPKTVSNMEEVKARGAMIIAVCRKGMTFSDGVVTYKIEIDTDVDDILMPLPTVVALQLLAYYISVLRGNDADKPRNLAKSVTIE